MQKPTPVGSSMGAVAASVANAAATASRSVGNGFGLQNAGYEQISALFENGVTEPMRPSPAAHCSIRSRKPGVGKVSEFSSSTSPTVSARARLTVPTKPRLQALYATRVCGRDAANCASIGAIAGSGEASSTSNIWTSAAIERVNLAKQAAVASAAS